MMRAQTQDVLELHAAEYHPDVIAERVGIKPRSVERILQRHGKRPKLAPIFPKANKFARIWNASESTWAAALAFGVTRAQLFNHVTWLKRRGHRLKRMQRTNRKP